jgi:hypothetical protein
VGGQPFHPIWGIVVGRFRRRIDPDGVRQDFEAWWTLHEALGMRGVRGQARVMTDLEHRGGASVVDVGRREIAQPAVMVRIVVPREEIVADAPSVFDRTEPVGKLRPVLERPELGFGKRIVVAHAGPRVTRVDAEVREQLSNQLAAHRRAAVGVECQLVRPDPLLEARGFDQALRQAGVLVRGDHPAHDVATEEIQDHIQRVIQVRDRPLQLRDVP